MSKDKKNWTKPNKRQKQKGWQPKGNPNVETGKETYDPNVSNESKGGPNDLNWYVSSEQVLNDAARIPYSIPVGLPFMRRGKVTVPSQVQLPQYDDAIPGIMVSYLMPTFGNPKTAGDTVNVAANGVYQFVRSRISGSRNYDAVDMMIYLGAMDSIYWYVVWLTRMYGTIFTYHQANRYLSQALIEAQGVDYNDLSANLANFRQAVNVKLQKINALYLPSILPIINRHSWLFSHYFIEGESMKDQIYCHVPAGIYLYRLDSDGAGMLKAHRIPSTPGLLTTTNLLQALDSMIDPIFQDEDFNRISGDMLKAYEGNVMNVTSIPDIATVELMFNEGVLLQFKNAKYKCINSDGAGEFQDSFFDYVQDTDKHHLEMLTPVSALNNYVYVDGNHNFVNPVTSETDPLDIATLAAVKYDWSKDTLITSPRSDVTPGESMINTRLTLAIVMKNQSDGVSNIVEDQLYFGSEWPLEYRLFCYHRKMDTGVTTLFWRRYDSHMAIGVGDNVHTPRISSWITSQDPIRSAFKYMPELTLVLQNNLDHVTLNDGRTLFEVDNYALISPETVNGLHNAAILGEFKIPTISLGK